jgi:cell division protein FtsW (lipid II flippase)
MKKNKHKPIDTTFFTLLVIILVVGVLIFISASLGILAKNEEKFYSVLANHIGLGLIGGFVAFFYIEPDTLYVLEKKMPFTYYSDQLF